MTQMTRQSLYDLVWTKPMSHIAKDYAMTDTGIRKYCVRHDIPTPRVGHWAKIAHGKSVHQTPLPIGERAADEAVQMILKSPLVRKVEQVVEQNIKITPLIVADELPNKPHPVVRSTRSALRKLKADDHGFITLDVSTLPEVTIGKDSIQRALRLMQTLFAHAEKSGYSLATDQRNFCWLVDGEPFTFKVYEAKRQEPHVATAKELKKQAQYSRWSESKYKVYRKWDYIPTGHLSIALKDTNDYGWRSEMLTKRWKDRRHDLLETFLAEIFIWIEPASVLARERRLANEVRRKKEDEERERQRIIRERMAIAKKLGLYLDDLTETHAKAMRVGELVSALHRENHSQVMERMMVEARSYQHYLNGQLDEDIIAQNLEINRINFDDEELFMPIFKEGSRTRYYY